MITLVTVIFYVLFFVMGVFLGPEILPYLKKRKLKKLQKSLEAPKALSLEDIQRSNTSAFNAELSVGGAIKSPEGLVKVGDEMWSDIAYRNSYTLRVDPETVRFLNPPVLSLDDYRNREKDYPAPRRGYDDDKTSQEPSLYTADGVIDVTKIQPRGLTFKPHTTEKEELD